jgi:triacylglycerol lipase
MIRKPGFLQRTLRLASLLLSAWLWVATGASAADTYTQTRYPIVLVHGLLGFDQIGPFDYFYGVKEALRDGGATVFVSQESASNYSEVRGEQLLEELQALRAAYGYTKFNLIAHSHGGQTARYVAAVAPELVASVTTMGTPHLGSVVADGIQRDTTATGLTGLAAAIVDALARFIAFLSGDAQAPQDSLGALASLTTAGAADFNARFPQGAPSTRCGQGPAVVNGVRYYSAGGTAVVTNLVDPLDGMLALTSLYFPWGDDNDGLVDRCSSHWGTVLRDDYPWNHGDEINQSFGWRGWLAPDPVAFYRTQANRLKLAGL